MPEDEILAHAGRMLMVAKALREKFTGEIIFSGGGKYHNLFSRAGFQFYPIKGSFRKIIEPLFSGNLSLFKLPAYRRELFDIYRELIKQELELYQSLQPDLIICDARPSASLAAEIYGLPVIWIINIGTLSYSTIKRTFPKTSPLFTKFPRLRVINKLPPVMRDFFFPDYLFLLGRFFWVKFHNQLRASFGLKPWNNYMDTFQAKQIIMADIESMAPTANLPKNYHFVGPLVWEPEMELPEPLKDQKDLIYITMGSTGDPQLFHPLIEAFLNMPEFNVVLTTGGLQEEEKPVRLPDNVRLYKFLPGTQIVKRARLVICHGGLGTIYQALGEGVPLIGIPYFPDQETMGIGRAEALGAGLTILPYELTPERIITDVKKVLADESYKKSAAKISSQFNIDEGPHRAAEIILGEISKNR